MVNIDRICCHFPKGFGLEEVRSRSGPRHTCQLSALGLLRVLSSAQSLFEMCLASELERAGGRRRAGGNMREWKASADAGSTPIYPWSISTGFQTAKNNTVLIQISGIEIWSARTHTHTHTNTHTLTHQEQNGHQNLSHSLPHLHRSQTVGPDA